MRDKAYEIICGDALAVLKTLESESVQCAITSPPYYGLRSYKTVPQIWDNHNGCSHEWGDQIRNPKLDTRPVELKIAQGGQVGSNVATQHWAQGNLGNFCQSCNAWRGELGLEPDFKLYISHLIQIFAEVKRVLKKDGTCFVNLGDSYAGSWGAMSHSLNGKGEKTGYNARPNTSRPQGIRPKSLMNIPARFAIAMTDELQFIQRNELIWHKPACMPSSATDRFTVDFEPVYFFSKNAKYKFNQQLEKTVTFDTNLRDRDTTKLNNTPGKTPSGGLVRNDYEFKNKRTVWSVNFEPQSDAHYASYPTKLVEPMILAGTDEGDTVLDIFAGTGTTLLTALRHRRKALGIELQPDYIKIAEKRLREVQVELF